MSKIIRVLVLLLLPTIAFSTYAESVRIQVIDVAQADGMIIRTPSNKHWIVIDAGTGKAIADYLVKMEVKKIDLAIVSHRHFDHHGGMDNVLRAVPTTSFIGLTEDCPNRTSDDAVRTAIAETITEEIPLQSTPQIITIDGVKLTILPLPPRAKCPEKENLNSIVVRLDYNDFSMLFTGDAEEDELEWLLTNHRDLLDVDILKASHHGCNNGRTPEFILAVSPERVVISAGVNAKYKHPMPEAVADYIQATSSEHVYCTNRHGTVRLYGFKNGTSRFYKQNKIDKSCVFDGTHR